MIRFFIHAADEIPIYRQIARQIVEGVASGALQPGSRLPSHRELSKELVVAPMTVKKAYDELETAGYLETHRGLGTFITDRPPTSTSEDAEARVRRAARQLLSEARMAGLDQKAVGKVLKEENQKLRARRDPHASKEKKGELQP